MNLLASCSHDKSCIMPLTKSGVPYISDSLNCLARKLSQNLSVHGNAQTFITNGWTTQTCQAQTQYRGQDNEVSYTIHVFLLHDRNHFLKTMCTIDWLWPGKELTPLKLLQALNVVFRRYMHSQHHMARDRLPSTVSPLSTCSNR